MALLAQSCIIYSDKDEPEKPRFETARLMHYNVLLPVYKSIELVDFFDRYQAVREDRDAAVALGREYYGDYLNEEHLVYENYLSNIGSIHITDVPGKYIIQTQSEYYGDNDEVFYVEVLGDRRYHIATTVPETKLYIPPVFIADSEIKLDCTATVGQDNVAVIETMYIKYEEKAGEGITTAEITSTDSPVKIQFCSRETGADKPYSGVLEFKLSGELVNDEFSVKYSDREFKVL